jgi:LAGLIDADG endonuclease
LTQHSRDILLLKGIVDFFNCGRVELRNNKQGCDFTVNSFSAFENKIIPFFLKYPMQGSKLLNFKDFIKVVEIIKAKEHLTEQGMNKIKEIKSNMNEGRK